MLAENPEIVQIEYFRFSVVEQFELKNMKAKEGI